MRIGLLIPTLTIVCLAACHKEYTCTCNGLRNNGEPVSHREDYQLANRKDAKTLCDSAKRDFVLAQPDITDVNCSLK